MRRVVVTGLGMVTPLASGVKPTWERLIAGESGIGPITRFDAGALGLSARIAGQVPLGNEQANAFNPDLYMEPKEQR